MKAIAAEAGLDPVLVERAARLMPPGTSESRLERVLGGPLKHRLDAHFATTLTEERASHLLSAVRSAVEKQGEGEANSAGMSWHSVGEGSQMFATAHTEGDGTRVRVTVDRREGLVVIGTSTLIGALAVGIATVVGLEVVEFASVPVGWALLGSGVAGSLALGRAVWVSTTGRVRENMAALMDTISRSLAETDSESPQPNDAG